MDDFSDEDMSGDDFVEERKALEVPSSTAGEKDAA